MFPKFGFWQQAKNASASLSSKGRRNKRSVWSVTGGILSVSVSCLALFFDSFAVLRYTHSIRFPSGSRTTLSKYPSPEVRGSPAMVYPSERICSVKRNTSSWLGKVKAKCVSPTLFSSMGVFCTSVRLISSKSVPSPKEIK